MLSAACVYVWMSDDLTQGMGAVGFVPIGKITDNVLAGDDADETVKIIDYGNEVLIHGVLEQFFHADSDPYRGIAVAANNVAYMQLFHGAHGTRLLKIGIVRKEPPGDDRDGRITMMPHFFQSLTEGEVIIKIGNTTLGDQKISNVHCNASFLRAKTAVFI